MREWEVAKDQPYAGPVFYDFWFLDDPLSRELLDWHRAMICDLIPLDNLPARSARWSLAERAVLDDLASRPGRYRQQPGVNASDERWREWQVFLSLRERGRA